MPGKPGKPHRVRVRVLDGKPREPNGLKAKLVPHVDVQDVKDKVEFVVCAVKPKHLEDVRAKLGAAGLQEMPGGDTEVPARPALDGGQPNRWGERPRDGVPPRGGPPQERLDRSSSKAPDFRKKPYGFVPVPKELTTATPVWHDGTCSEGRLSGEVRCELETLTPLLVGWERRQAGDDDEPWPITEIEGLGTIAKGKSVLCPLRAPWGNRPVIIPGDSLKGLLRHELGALLGGPMERVAERSYSYRPNAQVPKGSNLRLFARLARVPDHGTETRLLKGSHQVRVPKTLELLPANLSYDKERERSSGYYRFDEDNGAPYRGGQGAGEKLNSKIWPLHRRLTANPNAPVETVDVPPAVVEGYLATLGHLIDLDHGHFAQRHPDVPTLKGEDARSRILQAAANEVFQPGDMVWVEWDTDKKCIVSLGWHYRYRWAYMDSVRTKGGNLQRHGLFPLPDECAQDSKGAPKGLSAVRRLFGYTGDNEGSAGIGSDDHAQLMGRVSVNAGIEVVEDGDSRDTRFLPPTFLRELGMPRPSAVEYYVQQEHPPRSRPSDKATLVTYGDAAGYDTPGELAGRKFYLDRKDAYTSEPWKDDSPDNRKNERSTLALEASRPGRRFRLTVRFRDLDPAELAAIVVALCPHQFRNVLGGKHVDGYCSKLGYARPLGWGSVRLEAKALLLMDLAPGGPTLKPEADFGGWVKRHHQPAAMQKVWLDVHRHQHPDAADYPTMRVRKGKENIFTFHATLRAKHSQDRRSRNGGGR